MSNSLFTNLAWLAQPPADFNQQCRGIRDEPAEIGRRIRKLASYALDINQLHRLAKVISQARQDGFSLGPLSPFRLGILSDATVDFIVPALLATASRHGIELECVAGDFGQVVQEALSPESRVNRAKPDAVLVAIDARGLGLRCKPGDRASADAALDRALSVISSVRSGIRQNCGAVCILQTLAPFPETLFGNADRALPGTLRSLIDELNRRIAQEVLNSGDVLLDIAALAESVGLGDWHSPTEWNSAKLPFSNTCLPLYAEHVGRLIGALRGKSRKCLVLDLDNTVWGGVIGDDGLEGIQIAQGDGTGEAFLSVQRFALDLRERGIVLAVSSKNNDETARLPFKNHPEMLLREQHFAVFQANWNDKATNIKAIAEDLSLGIDSIVLLDDNPVERGLVRELLPEVAVPELPADPALYTRTLAAAGYFEAISVSAEDMKRAEFYRDNARRVTLLKQTGGVDAYLASLNMEITFQPFDQTGRARVTQLINKSNQFNLTTRRYTESEVAAAQGDGKALTMQVRLSDRFGDNGMISVVICREQSPRTWEIDTWLMSCRVLGRRVENMVLLQVLDNARRAGISRLTGRYVPTEKNSLVRDHYAKLGFTLVETLHDGTTVWNLDVENAKVEGAPMVIRVSGEIAVIGADSGFAAGGR